jgi:hypothetical protein
VVAIPRAAGVLYRYGVVLPPAIGAVVMSLSTIIVAVNARLISYRKKGRGADSGSGSLTQNSALGGPSQV